MSETAGDKNWLRTDEAEDVLSSLRHAIACFELAKTDKHAFKWLILALHSALQGACVCHLTTTFVPVGAVTNKNTTEWLDWREKSHGNLSLPTPQTRIADFVELLKRVRRPHSAGDRSNENGIAINGSEFDWLKRIHGEIRNQFVHFAPMGWSIELSGIPSLTKLIVRIVRDIRSCGWAFWKKDAEWHVQLKQVLNDLDALASADATTTF